MLHLDHDRYEEAFLGSLSSDRRRKRREYEKMKILLAVDGSVHSDAAARELAKRPWPPQSEVKVITAVEIPVMIGAEPWAACD